MKKTLPSNEGTKFKGIVSTRQQNPEPTHNPAAQLPPGFQCSLRRQMSRFTDNRLHRACCGELGELCRHLEQQLVETLSAVALLMVAAASPSLPVVLVCPSSVRTPSPAQSSCLSPPSSKVTGTTQACLSTSSPPVTSTSKIQGR